MQITGKYLQNRSTPGKSREDDNSPLFHACMVKRKRKNGRQRIGCYKNCQEHRISAGLEVSDLVALLGQGGPKERTLRRLEQGRSIRLSSAYKVFHALNGRLGRKFDADEEIEEL